MTLFTSTWSQSLKDQGKSRTTKRLGSKKWLKSQSLKDQGKSRTTEEDDLKYEDLRRNPLKIRASLGPMFYGASVDTARSQSLKDQGKSRTSVWPDLEASTSQSLKDQGKSRTLRLSPTSKPVWTSRNPLKIRASLGLSQSLWPLRPTSQSLKDQGKSRTENGTSFYTIPSRNPLKIRASLGLWTAWHSHVDSRFHCANIRHKREEKVAGPKLIHIKSLLAF